MKRTIAIAISVIMLLVSGKILFFASADETFTANQILTDVPVSIDPARRENLSSTLSLVGTVLANNDVNLVSQGEVVAAYHEVGDQIAAGTVIAQVDDK